MSATHFSEEIVELVLEASKEFGYPVTKIVSGAGHDAKYLNEVTKTGMIFLRSIHGISHNEKELTINEDIFKGGMCCFLYC